jgi:hypothetical protein
MSNHDPAAIGDLDPELAGLERRTWRRLGDDGLADLMLGLGFLCFGAGMVWNWGTFAAVAPAICVMNWKPLHNALIVPRRGVARLRPERRRLLRGAMARMVALQFLLVLVGVAAWQVMAHETLRARLANSMPILVMLPFPLILALLGKWFDVPRFYAQAAALLLAIFGLHLVGAAEGWPLLVSGTLLVGHSAALLIRFFHSHPRSCAA